MSGVRFELIATDPNSGLRIGRLHTAHGTVATPSFMPVGTLASVKSLTPSDVKATGARIVLSNTYHLSLQPGIATVERKAHPGENGKRPSPGRVVFAYVLGSQGHLR